MNKSGLNNEADEGPSLFVAYEDEIDDNVTFKYHRRLFSQKYPEDPLKELYLYDVNMANGSNIEIALPKTQYEEEPRRHLPKWIRQEMKNDKKAWKQIHRVLKQTPKYQPEYFSPLPEVEHVIPNYQQYEKYIKPQNNEKNENSQDNNEKIISQDNNAKIISQSSEEKIISQSSEEKRNSQSSDGKKNSRSSEVKRFSQSSDEKESSQSEENVILQLNEGKSSSDFVDDFSSN